MNTQYSIKVMYPDGTGTTLEHRNRTRWCKATARKHLKDITTYTWFIEAGCTAKIIEA